MGDNGPAPDMKRKRSKRKRKDSTTAASDADFHPLPPEEQERRLRQKYLRDLALKLRSQGQDYNPKRHKGKKAVQDPSSGRVSLISGHKPRKAGALQLVLIPITWDKREQETHQVLNAVAQAQQALRDAGVKCDTDSSTMLTPGQKYRHWEEKGVMLRVEIGPNDAARGVSVLAKASVPGQVAQKKTYAIGKQLVEAVCSELGLPIPANVTSSFSGIEKKESTNEKKSTSKEFSKKKEGTIKKDSGDDVFPIDGVDNKVDKDQAKEESNPKKTLYKSGDDLDGDFGGLVEKLEQEKEAHTKKGRKKAAKAAAEAHAADDDDAETTYINKKVEGWPPADDEKASGKNDKTKKHKVVKF